MNSNELKLILGVTIPLGTIFLVVVIAVIIAIVYKCRGGGGSKENQSSTNATQMAPYNWYNGQSNNNHDPSHNTSQPQLYAAQTHAYPSQPQLYPVPLQPSPSHPRLHSTSAQSQAQPRRASNSTSGTGPPATSATIFVNGNPTSPQHYDNAQRNTSTLSQDGRVTVASRDSHSMTTRLIY